MKYNARRYIPDSGGRSKNQEFLCGRASSSYYYINQKGLMIQRFNFHHESQTWDSACPQQQQVNKVNHLCSSGLWVTATTGTKLLN
jgi:hypothetical protein